MAELLGLAAACFLAYLHLRPEQTALAVAVATLANTAGGTTSYLIGRLIRKSASIPARYLVVAYVS